METAKRPPETDRNLGVVARRNWIATKRLSAVAPPRSKRSAISKALFIGRHVTTNGVRRNGELAAHRVRFSDLDRGDRKECDDKEPEESGAAIENSQVGAVKGPSSASHLGSWVIVRAVPPLQNGLPAVRDAERCGTAIRTARRTYMPLVTPRRRTSGEYPSLLRHTHSLCRCGPAICRRGASEPRRSRRARPAMRTGASFPSRLPRRWRF